jgi:Na+-driven multidrug efflux pump
MQENALLKTNSPSGGTLKKILIFALPYIILNILQNLFQTTDIAVLGIMVDESAVAAVGATSSLNNLLINFFIGLSVGVQSILARHIAAKNKNDARRTVGAALFFAIFVGVVILFGAYPFIEDILRIMRCIYIYV